MYGFVITKGSVPENSRLGNPKQLGYGEFQFLYSPMPRFEADKLFYEDAEKIVLLDGVIFNKAELLDAYGNDSWQDTFDLLYHADQLAFAKKLRGSFCGAVLNKEHHELLLFVNQSGEKPVYYSKRADFFVAASHNDLLIDVLESNGETVRPSIQACRELLGLASVLHGNTPFEGVRRLNAGRYLRMTEWDMTEVRYHVFHNVPEHEMSLEACVEEADKRFRKAVDRIFGKNKEYGYQSECDLSGGLDSRMATWVAHDLGYRDILNVCYCQSGNIDHLTSRKIAHDLGNDYFFLPMDGGELLMDVDEVVGKFGGQVSYVVCTGANRALREIASRNIGLCATGLLGELHNAYWVEGNQHTPPAYTSNRYSAVAEVSIPPEYSEGYENYEQMNLYEYSTLLWLSSALVRQQVCEVTSPFIDVDYLEFAYRIPLKWRKDYLFTKTWMVTKYPEAAKYVWQTKRMPVDKAYYNKLYIPKVLDDVRKQAVRCANKLFRMAHVNKEISYRTDMNPFDLWMNTNPSLQAFFTNYYQENIERVQDLALRADIQRTFEQGNARDKIQAINLLAVYKRYF